MSFSFDATGAFSTAARSSSTRSAWSYRAAVVSSAQPPSRLARSSDTPASLNRVRNVCRQLWKVGASVSTFACFRMCEKRQNNKKPRILWEFTAF